MSPPADHPEPAPPVTRPRWRPARLLLVAVPLFLALCALATVAPALTGGELPDRTDTISALAGAAAGVAGILGLAWFAGTAGETRPTVPAATHEDRPPPSHPESTRTATDRRPDERIVPVQVFGLVVVGFLLYAAVSGLAGG
ncbi:hypothetical protein [Actinoplanes sp. NPDC026619]|uniref:hypothetical protein n=1 Tax=Actinoplanes sp. NPDC026619 TaxID=3155798 RepID=UPI0033E4549B